MQKTTNYNLKKPEVTDPLRVADFNENADILDAAVAAVTTKVEAAYSASNSPFALARISTEGKVAGNTVYTFPKTPKCVLVQGIYDCALIWQGVTMEMCDEYNYNFDYAVEFQLSGASLIMKYRTEPQAAAYLSLIAFY